MYFADIHIHALSGTDDGPKKDEETFSMIDEAYSQGVRAICFTPHWNPSAFGNNSDKSVKAFEKAKRYISEKKYKMFPFLGNELRYSPEAIEWLRNDLCRSLNKTKFVLVDFSLTEWDENIVSGLRSILNCGYKPVFAHVERYSSFKNNLKEISIMRSYGVKIQLDAASVLGEFGFSDRIRSLKLLTEGLADIVSSDAHNMKTRPILLKKAFEVVSDKFGESYAERLFWKNPAELLIV